jgi:hypothetical protein
MNFQFNSLCSYLFPRARPTGCDGSSTAPVSGAVDSPLVIDRGMRYVKRRALLTVGSHPGLAHAHGSGDPAVRVCLLNLPEGALGYPVPLTSASREH